MLEYENKTAAGIPTGNGNGAYQYFSVSEYACCYIKAGRNEHEYRLRIPRLYRT